MKGRRRARRRRTDVRAVAGSEVPGHDFRHDVVDGGSVTVEAAMALAVLAVVLVACLAGVACVIAQVRCADAAREAARLFGRGDAGGASAAVAKLAPDGPSLSLGGSGDLVMATVSVGAIGGILPGVIIRASASAAREPAP